jgi:DNA-binding beta-propeller fold protein YncE
LAVGLLTVAAAPISAQVDLESVEAQEEFQWGVRSFHSAQFNEAIRSFARTLSLAPEDLLARQWLGHAYYRSGLVDAAVAEWEYVAERQSESTYLESIIDRVRRERSISSILEQAERWVTTTELQGRDGERVLFKNPTSVRPRPDGSFYVVSFASDEILIMNPNGIVLRRVQGGVQGFVQPFDLVEAEGSLFVTEFGADRIAKVGPNGGRQLTFGRSGIDEGSLLGPQYIAHDGAGVLYVTDWGNSRVCKFTTEGEFIQCFGEESDFFRGLTEPTGIVVRDQTVYVADAAERAVFVFDTSGNLLREIGNIGLVHPEALRPFDREHLLVADRSRLLLLDTDDEVVSEFSDVTDYQGRVTTGAVDANQNLVATDLERDRLLFLSPLSEVYSGLTVTVHRVVEQAFPRVFVDVAVEDARGNPVVGLAEENFRVTENKLPVEDLDLVDAVYRDGESEVSILLDRSPTAAEYLSQLGEGVREVASAIGGSGRLRMIAASQEPAIVAPAGSSPGQLASQAQSTRGIGRTWSFDRGLRLAAGELLESRDRRAVVYITTGSLPGGAYQDYELTELADYLSNNDIRFYPVYVTEDSVSQDLAFLAEQTGGRSYFLYRPEGLGDLARHVQTAPQGRYTLRVVSRSDSDFGRRYIPLEVEAYLIQRSGRGELGYFGPLDS